jgi:hypothetical protein
MVLLGLSAAWAGEQTLVLREHLNLRWTRELVTYPFTPPKGACLDGTVTLTGPQGPQPVQLIQVEHWPGTQQVKSARIAFIADLEPLATNTYTVRYSATPPKGQPVAAPATTLTCLADGGFLEVATPHFGLRCPKAADTTWPTPVDPKDVPGPVTAMRLADGTWFGGSSLYGARKITGYRVRNLESGPVLARVAIRYTYEDGSTMEVTVQLSDGAAQATWDMTVTPPPGLQAKDAGSYEQNIASKDGWAWLLSPGLPSPLQLQTLVYQSYTLRWGQIKRDKYTELIRDLQDFDLTKEKPGPLVSLLPWAGWWNQEQQSWFNFALPGKGAILGISSLNPELWVSPIDSTADQWADPGKNWSGRKWLRLVKAEDGTILFRISANLGRRRWLFGGPLPAPVTKRREAFLNGCPAGVWPLDRVKDLVLDWPGDDGSHPRVFFTKADLARLRQTAPADPARINEMLDYVRVYGFVDTPTYRDPNALLAYLYTGAPAIAEKAQLVTRLRTYLGQLGNFDRMRQASQLASMYDALADSGLLTAQDRKLFQAQMAYLAYACADAGNWSYERGYCSGNQNMTVAHVLNQGMLAATIPTHPMAKTWSEGSLRMMEDWLEHSVGPKGEWPESLANYAEVSAAMLGVYAVAARNAGIHDYVADPRLKRLLLFLAKNYTPPDPRPFAGRSEPLMGSPPSGRGPAYHQTGLSGLIARAAATSDPELSRVLQWHWLREGQATGYLSDRMSGLEQLYMDPSLPAQTPAWGSEWFPQSGAILRQGLGTSREYYIHLAMDPKGYQIYPSENGGFAAIWAKGAPIAVRFAGHGYAEREEFLISRVILARNIGTLAERKQRFMYTGPMAITAFATLPRQDYLQADIRMEKPVALWHDDQTQTDVLPAWPPAPATGKPPVDWRRQVLFMKDRDAQGMNYLVLRDTVRGGQPTQWSFWTLSEKIGTPDEARDPAFLADKPGNTAVDARALKGDRFTAVGQCGVDVEYYIASPTDTPRHTLRWGHRYYSQYDEYQDLLHLQLPGDGAYFVALVPRLRSEAAPSFTTLGDGQVIKVKGSFGTDYAFLAGSEADAAAEGIAFHGTAASVEDRPGGLLLSLGAKGTVRHPKGFALEADGPASLRVGEVVVVELPADAPARTVLLTLPGGLALAAPAPGVVLQTLPDGRFSLTLPGGIASVMLLRV